MDEKKSDNARAATKAPVGEAYAVAAQSGWFKRNKGMTIVVQLMDGTSVEGILLAWDTYTVVLQDAGHHEPVLVNKHAIALFRRLEELNAVAG